jgi:hypothetical protein
LLSILFLVVFVPVSVGGDDGGDDDDDDDGGGGFWS